MYPHSLGGKSDSAAKQNQRQLEPHPERSSHTVLCTRVQKEENAPQDPVHDQPETRGDQPRLRRSRQWIPRLGAWLGSRMEPGLGALLLFLPSAKGAPVSSVLFVQLPRATCVWGVSLVGITLQGKKSS